MPFADIRNASSRLWEKTVYGFGDSGTGAIHQRFNGYSAVKRSLLRRPHFRRAYDRRFQSVLRLVRTSLFTGCDFAAFGTNLGALGGMPFRTFARAFLSRNVGVADMSL